MGVYIKGMEMPTNCRKCRFDNAGWCLATDRADNRTRFVKGVTYDSPQEWCHLVSVPTPHGDLIDKKTVSENLASVLNKKNPPLTYPDWNDAVVAMLTAPTIIPAEEGGTWN